MTGPRKAEALTVAAIVASLAALPSAAAGRAVYVTNNNSSNVSVIQSSTNSVTATASVGAGPSGIAIAPDGSRVYVTDTGPDQVSVIDTTTNAVVATVPVDANPQGIAVSPDGTTAYATNFGDDTVSVIDTSTNTVTATLPVGARPRGVAFTPNGNQAYVVESTPGTVAVIDTASEIVTDSIAVGAGPTGIAVTPDGASVYVTNQDGGTVSVIDTASGSVVDTVPVGGSPRQPAILPDGAEVYVPSNAAGEVAVIDTSTNSVTNTIAVGTNPRGVAFTPDGTRAYVPNNGSSNVSVIDVTPQSVLTTIALAPAGAGSMMAATVPNQGPTANFTGGAATAGSATSFDATSSTDADGTIATATWDFGDGSSGGGLTTSHTYANPGTYTAALTVIDNEGCSTQEIYTGVSANCNGSAAAAESQQVVVTAAAAPASEPNVADTTAPLTTIESGPPAHTRQVSATFVFSADEANVGFECSVDGDAWEACGSPEVVFGLGLGGHEFQVRAQDRAGNTGPPASFSWIIDRRAPKLQRASIRRDAKIRRRGLRRIYGRVGDGLAGTARAKVKLQLLGKRRRLAKGQCAFLSLKTGHRIVHSCRNGFNAVNGTTSWSLPVPARVRNRLRRADRYELLIRARDAAGNKKTYRVKFRIV